MPLILNFNNNNNNNNNNDTIMDLTVGLKNLEG